MDRFLIVFGLVLGLATAGSGTMFIGDPRFSGLFWILAFFGVMIMVISLMIWDCFRKTEPVANG